MLKKIYLSMKLMRIHQWVKNLLIFAPLFFARKLFDKELLIHSSLAFIAFGFAASFIYILNDIRDIESDRRHPQKKRRPLASSDLSVSYAYALMFCLLILSVAFSYFINSKVFHFIFLYLMMNVAYCYYLKQKAILDIVVIASGFVIRLLVGNAATNINLSMWIILMTFLLALFIALAKRRDDVLIYEKTGKRMRESIQGYNLKFIDSSMMIMAAVVLVSYVQYTTSSEVLSRVKAGNLYYTVFFVIVGVLRYLQITLVKEKSGSPTEVFLSDRGMILVLLSWIVSFYFLLY